MNITRILFCTLFFIPMMETVQANEASIALVSKVVLDVSKQIVGKEWEKAKRGETLGSGDKVKTGEKSVAIIKFKDNSLVRVRERSELTVSGAMNGSAFQKNVNMKGGVVGFNIKKQLKSEEFRFTSPTSVASIRGTGGLYTSTTDADTLTVVEGLVILTNSISSNSVDVPEGYTAISLSDGTIFSRPSTMAERTAALAASRASELENQLEFELQDPQGNKRQLIIDFKD